MLNTSNIKYYQLNQQELPKINIQYTKQLILQMSNYQQNKQFNKSSYNPQTHQNTQVCLLVSNPFTSRISHHQNIQAITKLLNLKQQHRNNKIKIKKKLEIHHIDIDGSYSQVNNRKNNQRFGNGTASSTERNTIISSFNLNNTIDKFIQKQELNTHRKNYYSCLDKCKVVTNSFDNLKNQIINKIKRNKKNHRIKIDKDKTILFQGIISKQKQKQKNKQNIEQKTERNFVIRQKCQNNPSRRAQRYMELTVAEFMDQSQDNISAAITKKFEELRKNCVKYRKDANTERQNNFLTQAYIDKYIKSVPFTHRLNQLPNPKAQFLQD